ncbi:nucleotide pyrophosphohydrolase [Acidiferrobacter thiooxydans]|uniref:Nucleotide pyrophosphohydrolase n=1 Tax=Acidiferrobacter thiooxydans TaxID=163359 RepID=A0A1C2G1X4_9GAMM|nr:nucleotide pyrophosphohydrolase [Acidiferrobacter thiooxydans]MDA8190537.1 nucleotide pyrophosphohydrolase [Gammaproteobacteria bacterium]RCN59479.1 nucleotide pyrophosphohydrolase [Acidiferrobacter thiooxydans]UEO00167.1 nucleotide pyrophosphohydrolase [Acidiferrobacter thiooxydans]
MSSFTDLTERLAQFAKERDWEQFHSPKNLAMALIVEAGELVEPLQWLSEDESRALSDTQRQAVSEEAADVLLYLLRLCDRLGIDLEQAAWAKIAKNAAKYPADKVRGSARKYTDYL